MRTWFARIAVIAAVALAHDAHADKVLVLKSDGRVDPKVRARIDAAILKLAKTTPHEIAPGDITYTDAAAAVGCAAEEAGCTDQVLDMFAVDEIVITSLAPKPGAITVSVLRVGKGGATREATATVTADTAEKLDPIAALFGAAATPPARTTTTPPARPPVTTPDNGAASGGPDDSASAATDAAVALGMPPRDEAPTVPPASSATDPAAPTMTSQPGLVDSPSPQRSRLPRVGMITGGSMVVVGVLFWASAAGVQEEIDGAPTRSKQDLLRLQDLEAKGDTYAMIGNVLAIGGVVVGSVSTYYFFKGRRARSQTARITPMVFGDGGGIAITFGGAP